MKTIAYVDGFNLYYAIRRLGMKWLNVSALIRGVLDPAYQVTQVKYYTARVSGAVDPAQPRRQQIYLNALATTPDLEAHFGNFLAKTQWRPIVSAPIESRRIHGGAIDVTIPAGTYDVEPLPGDAKGRRERLVIGHYPRPGDGRTPAAMLPAALLAQVFSMEEKGSDVNLACHLVNDAHLKKFDVAAVLSNDSDLEEPIRIVTKELGKKVLLLSPPRGGAHKMLARAASAVVHIHKAHLVAAQFPDKVVNPAGGPPIEKPPEWA